MLQLFIGLLLISLRKVGEAIFVALVGEVIVKRVVIHVLKWLAKKSTNDLDDEIVAELEKALFPSKDTVSPAE